MDIHRYEKGWFAAALLLILLFIGTVVYGAVGAGIQMIDEGEAVDPNALGDDERFGDPGVHEASDPSVDYEVVMIAFHPGFFPGDVTLPANNTVTFYITAQDVIHGIDVVGTNVNAMVIPGQVTEFTVEFDETGEYHFICNEYCGESHHDMAGMITVVPEDEWNDDEMLDSGGED